MDSFFHQGQFVSDPACQEIPYFGLTRLAGKAFALEQYCNAIGVASFAEWFAKIARDGLWALGHVMEADDVPDTDSVDDSRETFGYEVIVHMAKAPTELNCTTKRMDWRGRIEGLPLDVRNGLLLGEFAKREGYLTFALWFAAMSEGNFFIGCEIEDVTLTPQTNETSYVIVVKKARFLSEINSQA